MAENTVLTLINEKRIEFDLEKSEFLLGGSRNYMMTKITNDSMYNLMETLEMFQEEGLNAWYHLDSGCFIHEIPK